MKGKLGLCIIISVFLFLLVFPVFGLPSRETPATAGEEELLVPTRKILVFYRNESSTLSEAENRLIYESLLVSLQGVRNDAHVIEANPLAGPDSDDEKSSLVRRRACDGWFLARVSDAGEDVRVEYTLYDSVNLSYEARESFQARRPDTRDLARVFWRDAAASLRGLAPLEPLPSYLVTAKPDTFVYGFDRRRLRIGRDGTARVTVPVPGIYDLRAERTGYDPVERQVLLKESGGELVFEQKRGSLFSVDFSMQNAQFPGLDIAVFAVPNSVFLKAGFTSFKRGIGGFLTASDEEPFEGTVGYPLMHLVFQAGFYGGQPDSLVRTYFGAGALARLFLADGGTVIEPVIPYGVFPVFGVEFSTNPKLRFYLEATPTAYYVSERNYIAGLDFKDFVEDYLHASTLGIELFRRWYVDLAVFRIGCRWHL